MTKVLGFVLATVLLLSACDTERKIDGTMVPYYGFLTSDDNKDKCVNYAVSGWNVAGAIVLSETLVVPFLVCGLWLFKPVSRKPNCAPKATP
jgi:hypothetical protein